MTTPTEQSGLQIETHPSGARMLSYTWIRPDGAHHTLGWKIEREDDSDLMAGVLAFFAESISKINEEHPAPTTAE